MSSLQNAPRTVLIRNKRGLHARASAKFVQLADSFDAEISVTKGEQTVGGTSIMGLMMLAAAPGCEIVVDATGPEADKALEAVCALVSNGFGEDD